MARMESGRVSMHSDESEWRLHQGEGNRSADKIVHFGAAFQGPPQVIVGLAYIDCERNRNARLSVGVTDVQPGSFQIEFRTWLDSWVWGVEASWIAFGD
jgi:hypothetical protein